MNKAILIVISLLLPVYLLDIILEEYILAGYWPDVTITITFCICVLYFNFYRRWKSLKYLNYTCITVCCITGRSSFFQSFKWNIYRLHPYYYIRTNEKMYKASLQKQSKSNNPWIAQSLPYSHHIQHHTAKISMQKKLSPYI